jgi:hypothetical protein
VSKPALTVVRSETGTTPHTLPAVHKMFLDVALGNAEFSPASGALGCRLHHWRTIIGFLVRQTQQRGEPHDNVIMVPDPRSREVAGDLVRAMCRAPGSGARLDTVYSCGHWR